KSEEGDTTYYVYNSKGERVRKVLERPSGSPQHERLFVGAFETYLKYDCTGECVAKCETLHVRDDSRRIALLETETINDGALVVAPRTLLRLQIDNHLESSAIELDDAAEIISYEEYYSYGSTSYEAVNPRIKATRKRYRFTGRERDSESGFYYHGARYYVPWLGRWASPDPTGMRDGTNLYAYGAGNPIVHSDPTGTASNPPVPEKHLLESGGSALIGDYEGFLKLWNDAADKVLPAHWGKNGEEKIKAFEGVINRLKQTRGLGSNRAKGTARNVARRWYSKVRSQFGKIANEAGVSLKGVQVHHGVGVSGELHN